MELIFGVNKNVQNLCWCLHKTVNLFFKGIEFYTLNGKLYSMWMYFNKIVTRRKETGWMSKNFVAWVYFLEFNIFFLSLFFWSLIMVYQNVIHFVFIIFIACRLYLVHDLLSFSSFIKFSDIITSHIASIQFFHYFWDTFWTS